MPAPAKYRVALAPDARARLEAVARTGSAPAKRIAHARVLLMADADHPAGRYHDREIAAALGLHPNTVARVRRQFVTAGEVAAVDRRPRATPATPPRLDGAAEAHLVAICCSPPPAGRCRWTLSLLAKELVGRKVVASVCRETVRLALKKTR
jgi:hypothetical protein